jgi:hypothetical protein
MVSEAILIRDRGELSNHDRIRPADRYPLAFRKARESEQVKKKLRLFMN